MAKQSFFNRALRKLGFIHVSSMGRSFDAGRITRTTADWNPATSTADVEIQGGIVTLRARARDHERNNDYARRFYSSIENNVLMDGVGFSLQMKIADPNGKPDDYANGRIEAGWREWCKPRNCTVTGQDGFFDVLKLVLRGAARDGGILVEKIRDSAANDFAFALRLIEIDHLDIRFCETLQNGNTVFLGVEKTPLGKPVALWLTDRHPGESMAVGSNSTTVRRRVPVENLIHYFVRERPTQNIGVPWLCSAMTRLNHLKEYEKAELIAARLGAEKGGWFKTKDGGTYGGDGKDAAGNTIADSAPGQFETLPNTVEDFIAYDPKHPTDAFPEFIRATLRGVAAGGGISYFTLTGDDTGSVGGNRQAKLEENEAYKKIQSHMIRHLVTPIFEAWLETAFLAGYFDPLPFSKFAKFNAPHFSGRRWGWLNPEVDVRAALLAIDGGLATRSQYTAEQGADFEEMLEVLKIEKGLADDAGLVFVTPTLGGSKAEMLGAANTAPAPKVPPAK